MKKILIQLDSDRFASPFDAIVAYDCGADVVLSHGGVRPEDVRGLLGGAVFTRSGQDLKNTAVWIGGSDVEIGEQLLEQAKRFFFGPFRVSLMLDSNGCNTTASTAIARLAGKEDLRGKRSLVIGPGPVGLRSAVLLAREGSEVCLASIPPDLLADRFNSELAERSLMSARKAGSSLGDPEAACSGNLEVKAVTSNDEMQSLLAEAEIVVAAGPAGLRLLSESAWISKPGLKYLIDFNLTEPSGIEGIRPGDDFAEYAGKYALGALAVGNQKMRVHKACVQKLFERNDLVFDYEQVYRVARQLV